VDLRSKWRGDAALLQDLLACYREPHRRYHTLQHLQECFERFDELRDVAHRPEEVELAIWFHDAIYDPRRDDNEARSAAWARASVGERVAELVLATRHDASPARLDAQVLVDVDLWILGSPPQRFEEYERQVRQEYAWVPLAEYRRGRAELLGNLLKRPTIYHTPRFIERYEAQARRNLATR
jgi:predicted metal-dependent HD superfamily phosphohydrolase